MHLTKELLVSSLTSLSLQLHCIHCACKYTAFNLSMEYVLHPTGFYDETGTGDFVWYSMQGLDAWVIHAVENHFARAKIHKNVNLYP